MRLSANPRAFLVAAGLIMAVGLTVPVAADNLTLVTPPAAMPAFKIPGINGTSGSDTDLRNKVTIIRFWASWWSTCVSEMPSVQKAHNELKKDGIHVITISIDGTGEAAVKPVFARGGYTMPALIDQSMEVARGFGVRGVPTTVVVDSKGLISSRTLGHVDFNGPALRNYARSLAKK